VVVSHFVCKFHALLSCFVRNYRLANIMAGRFRGGGDDDDAG